MEDRKKIIVLLVIFSFITVLYFGFVSGSIFIPSWWIDFVWIFVKDLSSGCQHCLCLPLEHGSFYGQPYPFWSVSGSCIGSNILKINPIAFLLDLLFFYFLFWLVIPFFIFIFKLAHFLSVKIEGKK
jgi:hypothetical protein